MTFLFLLALILQDPAELVERLAHADIAVREEAAEQLLALRGKALGAVREGKKHADAEVRNRCAELERQLGVLVVHDQAAEKLKVILKLKEDGETLSCVVRNDLPFPVAVRKRLFVEWSVPGRKGDAGAAPPVSVRWYSMGITVGPEPLEPANELCSCEEKGAFGEQLNPHTCHVSERDFAVLKPGEEFRREFGVIVRPAGISFTAFYEFDRQRYLQCCLRHHPGSVTAGIWDEAPSLRLKSKPVAVPPR